MNEIPGAPGPKFLIFSWSLFTLCVPGLGIPYFFLVAICDMTSELGIPYFFWSLAAICFCGLGIRIPLQAFPYRHSPIQGIPIQGIPIQDNLYIGGSPIQGSPIQGIPIQRSPIQGFPVQGFPIGIPYRDSLYRGIPMGESLSPVRQTYRGQRPGKNKESTVRKTYRKQRPGKNKESPGLKNKTWIATRKR